MLAWINIKKDIKISRFIKLEKNTQILRRICEESPGRLEAYFGGMLVIFR